MKNTYNSISSLIKVVPGLKSNGYAGDYGVLI